MSRKVSVYSRKRKLASSIAYKICKYSEVIDFSKLQSVDAVACRYLLTDIVALQNIYACERDAVLDKIFKNKEKKLND